MKIRIWSGPSKHLITYVNPKSRKDFNDFLLSAQAFNQRPSSCFVSFARWRPSDPFTRAHTKTLMRSIFVKMRGKPKHQPVILSSAWQPRSLMQTRRLVWLEYCCLPGCTATCRDESNLAAQLYLCQIWEDNFRLTVRRCSHRHRT